MTNEGQDDMERFDRDIRYFNTHSAELLREHSDKWVAVYDGSVAGVAADLDDLLADLRSRGVPAEHSVVRFLTRKNDILVLPS